ncbi:DUF5687 family protein [Aureibacter tunicatorum]|uniref:Uncharacterized protein n=1 Tax=Aureibacter tunicatorum TaxID=866807 RepID=A0AAE3XM49_9BACT|nr:DUF5687 family protein [Aureibacter tunicatorum]MDR6237469.1 hypothetical protein [Aureibacter tunicatorum]BDD06458.1 hypothetical protein AUTU_39410 [Aureibacter tunicatorum]
MLQFFWHQWLSSSRKSYTGKRVLNLFIHYSIYILLLGMLALFSVGIKYMMKDFFPNQDHAVIMGGFGINTIFVMGFMRFMFNKDNKFSIKPYLHLPISQKSIINAYIFKDFISLFGLIPILVAIPFFINFIVPNYPVIYTVGWGITYVSLTFIFNVIYSILITKQKNHQGAVMMLFWSLNLIAVLDFYQFVSIAPYFRAFFNFIATNVWCWSIFPVTFTILLLLLRKEIKECLRKERSTKETQEAPSKSNKWLDKISNLGFTGVLVTNELKLIWRNKRPRSLIIASCILPCIIIYGMTGYSSEVEIPAFFNIMGALFVVGYFPMVYGQFLFAWESSFFTHYISQNVTINEYVKSKFWFLALITLINSFFAIPVLIIKPDLTLAFISAIIIQLGIINYLMILMGLFNSSRMDISKSTIGNSQGTQFHHFIMIFIIMAIPLGITSLFYLLDMMSTGYLIICVMGLIGFLLQKPLLNLLSKDFAERKYKMITGFKEN